MRLSDVKYKKYMIAASGLMGIILLLLVIFNIILPEQKTTEIEKAIVKMLQETNQKKSERII